MKKIILLLALAFVMCGCCNQYVTDCGIVEGVEINNGGYSEQGTYIVTISKDFKIGDKVKIIIVKDEQQ